MECKHEKIKGFIMCVDCNGYRTEEIASVFNNLKDENKLLKSQLAEIHQANVRLNNKVLELERDNKELKTKEHELKVLKFQDSFNRRVVESITNENVSLKEQLEVKEILNQDLAKKYQLLQEEIDAYDINMLELVEDYKKLEQDYNELQGKYNSLQEYAKNSSNNLFKVNLQHKVKPYLSEGVINVIVESNKEFK